MASLGKPAARMTDKTAHGGMIVTGDMTVFIGDLPAARVDDTQVCPIVDNVPHVGGTIAQGSSSVMIGDQYAARVGDPCPCLCGMSGKGIPAKLPSKVEVSWKETAESLEHPEKVEPNGGRYKYVQIKKKTNKKTDEEISEQGGKWQNMEDDRLIIVRDKEGNITYTEESFESAKERTTSADEVFDIGKYGPLDDLEARLNLSSDVGYQKSKEHDYSDVDPLDSSMEEWEKGASKTTMKTSLGPKGGKNPYISIESSVKTLSAEGKKDKFIGTDGRRYGFSLEGKAGASLAGADSKVTVDAGVLFPPLLLLRKAGYNIEIVADAGVALGDVSMGLGAHGYYDSEDKRLHIGAMGALGILVGKARMNFDISIGKMKDVKPPPGIPNTIFSGCDTVLIG